MSNTSTSSSSSAGIGFVGALTILFIALKLTGVIDWSWWWVTSPLWIAVALGALVSVLTVGVIVIAAICKKGS
jgi:membrane protein YdbS with pleckstrin-like domain